MTSSLETTALGGKSTPF